MGAKFSSSKSKNASNKKITTNERPFGPKVNVSSSQCQQSSHSIEEYFARVPAKRESVLQVINQRVPSIDSSLRVQQMREPVPQVLSQKVSPINHSSKIPEMLEPLPEILNRRLLLTDHSLKVPTIREPVPQVFTQRVSPTDHTSKVPKMKETVSQIFSERVPPIDRSSKVVAIKESVPQVFSKGISSTDNSSREQLPKAFNFNKMEKALTYNRNGLTVTHTNYDEKYILLIILEWNTEWLSECTDSETPNQLSPFGEGTGIKTCYNSLEEYQSAYIPLILIETWAQIYNDFNEESPFEFQLMRAPDPINKWKTSRWDDFLTLNLHTVVAQNKIKDYPSNGKLLTLEVTTDYGSSKTVFGYVVNFFSEEITTETKLLTCLSVPENCPIPQLLKYVVVVSKEWMELFGTDRQIQRINAKSFYYLRQTMKQIELLSNLNTSPLIKYILNPRVSASELVVPTNITLSSNKFNESQSTAILGISEAVNSPYTVPKLVFIQGPPGTGKTFTLIETLKHIYMNSEKRLPHILICAPSNGAVNEISRRLYKERGFLNEHPLKEHQRDLRCVRVGNELKIQGEDRIIWLEKLAKDIWHKLMAEKRQLEEEIKDLGLKIKKLDEEIENFSLSNNSINDLTDTEKERDELLDEYRELRAQVQQMKIDMSKIKMEIMDKADIVLATLNSSHSYPIQTLFDSYGSKTFNCVIVDEASQCSEPELLMPLIYKMSQMILIGDPKQLPATIISKKASSLNLGRSLFERFYDHFQELEENNLIEKSPVLMLTEQFRMYPQICQFPSSQFYGGKLTTNSEEMMKRDFNRLKPYILYDLFDTYEKLDPTTKSRLNLNEAKFVIRLATLIDQMVNRSANNQKRYTVGVITPYNAQKTHLINYFQYKRFNNINVDINTVDGFQGQERDIIIFSGVRAFHRKRMQNNIGFLDSVQRMNVSLTRAKYSMILCISGRSLKIDKTWKSLIDDTIRRRNIRFKVSSNQKVVSNEELKNILAPIQ